MELDTDLILIILLANAACIALCFLRPRWDTGGGALMWISLGTIGAPMWIPILLVFLICFLFWMIGCMIFYSVRFFYRGIRYKDWGVFE